MFSVGREICLEALDGVSSHQLVSRAVKVTDKGALGTVMIVEGREYQIQRSLHV